MITVLHSCLPIQSEFKHSSDTDRKLNDQTQLDMIEKDSEDSSLSQNRTSIIEGFLDEVLQEFNSIAMHYHSMDTSYQEGNKNLLLNNPYPTSESYLDFKTNDQPLTDPTCYHCHLPIKEKAIRILDRHWHPGHLKCSKCGKSLYESCDYKIVSERVYCIKDHDTLAKISHDLDRNLHSIHGTEVNGNHKCAKCHLPTSLDYTHLNVGYCKIHYQEAIESICAKCKRPIDSVDDGIRAGRGRCKRMFHFHCLKCSVCDIQLKSKFQLKEGSLFCITHSTLLSTSSIETPSIPEDKAIENKVNKPISNTSLIRITPIISSIPFKLRIINQLKKIHQII